MKKNFLILIAAMLVLVMSISGCVSEPAGTDEPSGTEIGDGTEISEGETGEEGETDEPELIIDSVPAFCGIWRCNYQGTDGNRWLLHVELLEDGSALYKSGPPESEFMVNCVGTWKLNEEEHILLDLVDTYEGFPFMGEYNWEVSEDGALSISSIIGDAFIYDTEGVTFVFTRY